MGRQPDSSAHGGLVPAVTACFGHLPYPCHQRAANAAVLHGLAYPSCEGAEPWSCGDHWHIGHTTAGAGQRCKDDVQHRETDRRLARIRAGLRRKTRPSRT